MGDVEAQNIEGGEAERHNEVRIIFEDKSIRRAFIRKVYSILSFQLGFTSAFVAIFTFYEPANNFILDYPIEALVLAIVSLVGSLILVLVLFCIPSARRTVPTNFILLFIFTIFESIAVGLIVSTYDSNAVKLSFLTCAVVCLALTVFAFQTKIDFTPLIAFLWIFLVLLFLFGLILSFFPSLRTLDTIYSAAGTIIFAVYLVVDTQVIIGGNHKYTIPPEEYILASLMLYLDIINLFLFILRLFGRGDNE